MRQTRQTGSYLVISKEGPDEKNLNAVFEYKIVVNNIGNSRSTKTTITDIVPNELDIISVTPSDKTTINGQVVTYILDSINIADEAVLTIKVRPIASGIISNKASVDASNNENLIKEVQKTTNVLNTPPRDAYLEINKTVNTNQVNINDTITYTIRVQNIGLTSTTKTLIDDNLPDKVEYISSNSTDGNPVLAGQKLTLELDSIKPMQTVVMTIIVRAKKEGIADNISYVSARNNRNPDNVSSVKVNIGNQPSFTSFLVISKIGPDIVNVGDEFNYKINVKNGGDIASTQAVIKDTIPNELQIISVNTDKGTIIQQGQNIEVTIDSVDITDNIDINIKAKALKEGNIKNTTTIQAINNSNPQNQSSQYTQINNQPTSGSFLEIKKEGKDNIGLQDEFNYVISVKNTGKEKATPLNIIDIVPSELQVISVSTTKGKVEYVGQNINVSMADLEINETVLVTIKVKAIKEGKIVNTSIVVCENNINPNTQAIKDTNITNNPKKTYTTGPLKKACRDNTICVNIDNTTSTEFDMKFIAQNLTNPNDKKDFNIKIPPKQTKYISICDLPQEYKIIFENISDGIYVLIISYCNSCIEQIIRQKDLMPE